MKCTRREWLGLGLGAGASVFGGRWNLSFAGEKTDSGPVNMTVIPSSGEQVPAVGLGTVKFQGNPDSDDLSQLRQTLQTFHRLGGRQRGFVHVGERDLVAGICICIRRRRAVATYRNRMICHFVLAFLMKFFRTTLTVDTRVYKNTRRDRWSDRRIGQY